MEFPRHAVIGVERADPLVLLCSGPERSRPIFENGAREDSIKDGHEVERWRLGSVVSLQNVRFRVMLNADGGAELREPERCDSARGESFVYERKDGVRLFGPVDVSESGDLDGEPDTQRSSEGFDGVWLSGDGQHADFVCVRGDRIGFDNGVVSFCGDANEVISGHRVRPQRG